MGMDMRKYMGASAFSRANMMTKKLNWQDRAGDGDYYVVAEARASRAVGGKYEVRCGKRADGNVWFEAQRLVNTGPGAWNNSLVKNNPIARTIEQAKATAEADNQRRLDEAKAKA
jgi:hypothetical protein